MIPPFNGYDWHRVAVLNPWKPFRLPNTTCDPKEKHKDRLKLPLCIWRILFFTYKILLHIESVTILISWNTNTLPSFSIWLKGNVCLVVFFFLTNIKLVGARNVKHKNPAYMIQLFSYLFFSVIFRIEVFLSKLSFLFDVSAKWKEETLFENRIFPCRFCDSYVNWKYLSLNLLLP